MAKHINFSWCAPGGPLDDLTPQLAAALVAHDGQSTEHAALFQRWHQLGLDGLTSAELEMLVEVLFGDRARSWSNYADADDSDYAAVLWRAVRFDDDPRASLLWRSIVLGRPVRYVSDAERFLERAVIEAGDDDGPRLVYADWLEQNGHDTLGRTVRDLVACESPSEARHKRIARRPNIDPAWLMRVSPPRVGPPPGALESEPPTDSDAKARLSYLTRAECDILSRSLRNSSRVLDRVDPAALDETLRQVDRALLRGAGLVMRVV